MDNQIDFLKLQQKFIAVDTLSSNTLRNQGRGTLNAIRSYLAVLPLREVPCTDAELYDRWLDDKTDEILANLQLDFRPWGAARKGLNLFMRACICDHYLRAEYGLARVEPLAEIPLDNIVAKALREAARPGILPKMKSLRQLPRDDHCRYQEFGADYAQQLGLPARVYLDTYLWLQNR